MRRIDVYKRQILRRALGHHLSEAGHSPHFPPEFEVQNGLSHRAVIVEGRGAPGKARLLHRPLSGIGQGFFTLIAQQVLPRHRPAKGAPPRQEKVQYTPCLLYTSHT